MRKNATIRYKLGSIADCTFFVTSIVLTCGGDKGGTFLKLFKFSGTYISTGTSNATQNILNCRFYFTSVGH